MPLAIQPSFARGEIAPNLRGRVDTAAYRVGLRTAFNLIIHVHGGASNRPGLLFVGECADHTSAPRLVDFKFRDTDTYILEFGNLYMRVIRDDAHVTESSFNIIGITQANPGVVTLSGAHSWSNGDEVVLNSIGGMTDLNGRRFVVASASGATFALTDQVTGDNIDTSSLTAYTSGGTAARIFKLTTPYVTADLARLKFTQSADVMTIVHPSYEARELARTGHAAWTLTTITFDPDIAFPEAISVNPNTTGSTTYQYQVTAIADETFEESLAGLNSTTVTITGATQANPVVITVGSHTFLDGDEIHVDSIVGMTELNGRRFRVANSTPTTFELEGEDGTGHTAYSSGGSANQTFVRITNGNAVPDNTIQWDPVSGAQSYIIYRKDQGLFGRVGETQSTSFQEVNIEPDLTLTPPSQRNPFLVSGTYPGAVSFYQQRRVFGGSTNAPDTSHYSQIGNHDNFTVSSPVKDTDAITTTLNSLKVNDIRHFVPVSEMIILTSGSEWRVDFGSAAAFTPSTIRQRPQSTWGSSHIRPLVVNNTILFITENLLSVRSLGFSLEVDSYTGTELSQLSNHFFEEHTAVDWAFMRSPDPVATMVRSDGKVLALTFDQGQEVVAWGLWETDGDFESVASIRPSQTKLDEFSYFVVKRTVNGNTVRYIERVASRRFTAVEDAFFVDSGLSLDNPLAITDVDAGYPVTITSASHGLSNGDDVDIEGIVWGPTVNAKTQGKTQPAQLNGGRYFVTAPTANTLELFENEKVDVVGATQANPVVITTSVAHGFSNGQRLTFFGVGGMTELNHNTYKVANKTDTTFELTDTSDVDIDGTGFTAYTTGGIVRKGIDGSDFNAYVKDGNVRAVVDTLSGLRHLAGREVVMLADGNVVEGKTVSATGTITLDRGASRVHVGLRYISDLETLDLEAPEGTIQGMKVALASVTVRFAKSRGLLVGPNADKLREMKQRQFEKLGEPTELLDGDLEINTKSRWDTSGRVYLRQKDPLPMSILAVMPDIEVGDDS